MTRDNTERLSMFARGPVHVKRIALNMDQIELHKPPPNFAKVTDSRYQAYVQEFGEDSWELDALEPPMIVSLIRNEVNQYIDQDKWDELVEQERKDKDDLQGVSENWKQVVEFMDQMERWS